MSVNSTLATVTSTQGVRGVAVLDASGVCIASELPAPYEPILVEEAVRRLAAVSDAFASLTDGMLNTFSARCEGGLIIVRRVADYLVLTLAAPSVNINLLNVALNVLALNLVRAGAGSGSASRAALSPASGSVSSVSGTLGSQMLTASQSVPGEVIPPDAVGRPRVIALLRAYALAIGPAAKVLLRQQLAELGVSSRTLRQSQAQDLIMRLAVKIPAPAQQQEFVDAARAILAG